ncbi:putative aminotransferase [Pseudomonas aeruginosa]|nr:putative aminotransferase [Pseudomonas aeruginosa]QBN03417.1 putative aminotransferase [Pseudomonas aeruginosa]
MDTTFGLDLARVETLFKRELRRFDELHPRSAQAYRENRRHWLYGAPLHWMQQWPGNCPLLVKEAQGARVTDIDGQQYVDFASAIAAPCSATPNRRWPTPSPARRGAARP